MMLETDELSALNQQMADCSVLLGLAIARSYFDGIQSLRRRPVALEAYVAQSPDPTQEEVKRLMHECAQSEQARPNEFLRKKTNDHRLRKLT